MSSPSSRSPRGLYKNKYTKHDILTALKDITNAQRSGRKLSFKAAGAPYHIPETTMRHYHKKTTTAIASSSRGAIPSEVMESAVSATSAASHKRLLTDDDEQKLVTWIEQCCMVTQPPEIFLIRHKAQRLHYAIHNIPITEENEDRMASEKWWKGFKSRHPTLTLRTAQPLDVLRARATQPEIINHFYDLLEYEVKTHRFQPHQIWAADETGVDDNFKVRKVVTTKGMHIYTTKMQHTQLFLHVAHVIFMFSFFRCETCSENVYTFTCSHVDYAYM